jgi:hypothetical protein
MYDTSVPLSLHLRCKVCPAERWKLPAQASARARANTKHAHLALALVPAGWRSRVPSLRCPMPPWMAATSLPPPSSLCAKRMPSATPSRGKAQISPVHSDNSRGIAVLKCRRDGTNAATFHQRAVHWRCPSRPLSVLWPRAGAEWQVVVLRATG